VLLLLDCFLCLFGKRKRDCSGRCGTCTVLPNTNCVDDSEERVKHESSGDLISAYSYLRSCVCVDRLHYNGVMMKVYSKVWKHETGRAVSAVQSTDGVSDYEQREEHNC
jgi:hypothetical protein